MVREHERRPRIAPRHLDPRGRARTPGLCVPAGVQRARQVEGQVESVGPGVIRHRMRRDQENLADQERVPRARVHEPSQLAQDGAGRGMVVQRAMRDDGEVLGVVGERGVLAEAVRDVHAEAVDAAVEPEAQHVVHGAPHLGVRPVEVGLLRQETVQVGLAGRGVERPRGPGREERRGPVVRWRAVGLRVAPHVPVALRRGARRARLEEPGMAVRGVVRHPVQQHAEPVRMRRGDHAIEVVERAEDRVDVAVVGDVVAEVRHRRAEHRREPDRVDAEARDVGQAREQTRQVADAVAVPVRERARVHLVHDRRLPPRHAGRCCRFRHGPLPPPGRARRAPGSRPGCSR